MAEFVLWRMRLWSAQSSVYAAGDLERVGHYLALPDGDYAPSLATERADAAFVALDVVGEFFAPVGGPGLGHGGASAALVAMPKAAVDEYDGFVFGQDDVRLAGQVAAVDAEAVAHAVQ